MTLDITKPTDEELVSVLPSYIRANRVAINTIGDIESGNVVKITDLAVPATTTFFTTGIEVFNYEIEVIRARAVTIASITAILGGTDGQIKIFIFQNSSLTFVDGLKLSGQFYLNQLPIGSNFAASIDDVLALVNIGGDGASEHGYWKEIWRMVSVK